MLDPLDSGCRGIGIGDDDDVEAHRERGEVAPALQQLTRRARDALLFAAIDARGRATVGVGCASAHFGDQQHAAVARDDIEFARTAAKITFEDLTAGRAQELTGERLGTSPALLSPGEQRQTTVLALAAV